MSIGAELKTARETKNISLETISKKTRIPIKYLESLEKDEFDVFPSQTYAKGFIRAYAKVVGLDQMKLTQQFRSQVKHKDVRIEPMNIEAEMEKGSAWGPIADLPVLHRQETHEDPELEQLQEEYAEPFRREPAVFRNKRIRSVRRAKIVKTSGTLALLVSGFLLVLAVYYYTQKGLPTIQFGPILSKMPSTSPVQAPGLADVVVPDKYQHLVVKGLDKSWVQVSTDDGKGTYEVDLDEGEVKIYQAVKNFKVKIGNAGGVDLYYNGKALGVLGVTGQVVEIDLPETDTAEGAADKG